MCVRKGSNQNVLTRLLSCVLEVEPVVCQKADKEIMTLSRDEEEKSFSTEHENMNVLLTFSFASAAHNKGEKEIQGSVLLFC